MDYRLRSAELMRWIFTNTGADEMTVTAAFLDGYGKFCVGSSQTEPEHDLILAAGATSSLQDAWTASSYSGYWPSNAAALLIKPVAGVGPLVVQPSYVHYGGTDYEMSQATSFGRSVQVGTTFIVGQYSQETYNTFIGSLTRKGANGSATLSTTVLRVLGSASWTGTSGTNSYQDRWVEVANPDASNNAYLHKAAAGTANAATVSAANFLYALGPLGYDRIFVEGGYDLVAVRGVSGSALVAWETLIG